MNSKVKSPNILTKIVGPCPYPCGDARCDNYSEPSSDCGGNPPSTKQYTDVTSDPNFISMVQIDQQLYDFTDTSLGLWSEAEFTSYLNSMNSAVNDAQVATVIQNAGYSNSTLIVATLNQKINKVLQLVQNNNRFAGKTPEEIKKHINWGLYGILGQSTCANSSSLGYMF